MQHPCAGAQRPLDRLGEARPAARTPQRGWTDSSGTARPPRRARRPSPAVRPRAAAAARAPPRRARRRSGSPDTPGRAARARRRARRSPARTRSDPSSSPGALRPRRRVDLDAVDVAVSRGDRLLQRRQAGERRIAVRIVACRRLRERVDHVRGRRHVRIAAAEVDQRVAALRRGSATRASSSAKYCSGRRSSRCGRDLTAAMLRGGALGAAQLDRQPEHDVLERRPELGDVVDAARAEPVADAAHEPLGRGRAGRDADDARSVEPALVDLRRVLDELRGDVRRRVRPRRAAASWTSSASRPRAAGRPRRAAP